MNNEDFWTGIRLVTNGLIDAAKKASYSIAFGAGGLGVAQWMLSHFGVTGPPALLIPVSAFSIFALIGRAIDDRSSRAALKTRIEHYLQLEELIVTRFRDVNQQLQTQLSDSRIVQHESTEKLKTDLQKLIEQTYSEAQRQLQEQIHKLKSDS